MKQSLWWRVGSLGLGAIVPGLLLIFVSGCSVVEDYSLTYHLWNSSDLSKFSEPASDPNIELSLRKSDGEVLVHYDAVSEKDSKTVRRAYLLRDNQKLLAKGKAPKWYEGASPEGMDKVALIPVAEATNAANLPEVYSTISTNGREFTLHGPKGITESYDLPVYAETRATAFRIAFTPPAVIGDTLLVGAAVATVGAIIWLQSGAPGLATR